MVARPPDVIVYATDTGDLDNLNVPAFERTVFPYPAVLAACYKPSSAASVYLANGPGAAQSDCIANQLRSAGLAY
jgi:hypothetical protein